MKVLVVLALVAAVVVASPAAARDVSATATDSPTVTGEPVFRETLSATAGAMPEGATPSYQWLRDGSAVDGATTSTYRLGLADIGHRMAVRVTPVPGDDVDARTSSPTEPVRKARFAVSARPRLTGTPRFEHTLAATPGEWSPRPLRVRYQWLRNGRSIDGARRQRYRLTVKDVGAKLGVRVTARRDGYRAGVARSRTVLGRHRVALRRTVTYSVTTRGRIHADLARFTRLAQQTYDDPRGWRGAGVAFRRVRSGGAFRLVLSEAAMLPSFGYPCDTTWSCRVGDNVIVNQDRWLRASPLWNSIGESLRDYRHMVVNHETGHWLGHRHRYCGGRGRPAPVMMQQSKGLDGCKANPWPLAAERSTPRF